MDTISVRKIQFLKVLKYVLINFIFLYLGLVYCFSCEDDLYRDCSDRVAQGSLRSVEGQVKTSSFYILLGGPILIFGFLEIRSYTRKTLRYDNLDFLIIDSLWFIRLFQGTGSDDPHYHARVTLAEYRKSCRVNKGFIFVFDNSWVF